MAVIFTDLVDGQAVNAVTFNTPLLALEDAILDMRNGVGFDPQSANLILAGPASGGASTPSFRALVADDVPALDAAKITSGIFGVSRGGTGANTATIGFDNLSPLMSAGDLVAHNGSNNVRVAVGSDGQLLYADSSAAAGVRWDDPSVALGDDTTLTINSGAVTVTGGHHAVDTESSAATDDLTTINGLADGQIVFIRSVSSDRVVTIKHAVGNIRLNGGIDFELDTPQKGVLFVASGGWVIGVGVPVTAGAGSGTVTSVALSAPAQFSVSGSPVTSSGTLAIDWANTTPNTVLAGPETGSDAPPTLRGLVAADIPSLDAAKITSGIFSASQIPLLDASKISSGTIDVARVPALDASKISSGTFGVEQIPTLTMSKISDKAMTKLTGYTELGSSVGSITIGSIVSTYEHLQLWVKLRSNSASVSDGLSMVFNGVTSNYYLLNTRISHNATLGSNEYLNTQPGFLMVGSVTGDTAPASLYSFLTIDIFKYSSSTQYKIIKMNGTRVSGNTTGTIWFVTANGYWAQNNVITSISLSPNVGTAWLSGSAYSLYGVG